MTGHNNPRSVQGRLNFVFADPTTFADPKSRGANRRPLLRLDTQVGADSTTGPCERPCAETGESVRVEGPLTIEALPTRRELVLEVCGTLVAALSFLLAAAYL